MNLIEVDPERYGSLAHPGDTFSYDMYSQAGAVARGGEGTVLGDLRSSASSRSASRSRRSGSPRTSTSSTRSTPVYDGFLVHARGGSALAARRERRRARSVGAARALPRRPPRAGALLRGRDRPDGPRVPPGAPARHRASSGSGRWRAPRTPTCTRSWSGSSTAARSPIADARRRVEADERAARSRARARRSTPARSTTCSRPRSRTSSGGCATARRRHGAAPREVRDDEPTQFVVDDHGNARGRHPHPARRRADRRRSRGWATTARRSARLFGTTVPFGAEQLASLYPSKADYCARFDAATDAAVAAGLFLAADAAEIKAIAAELLPRLTR